MRTDKETTATGKKPKTTTQRLFEVSAMLATVKMALLFRCEENADIDAYSLSVIIGLADNMVGDIAEELDK